MKKEKPDYRKRIVTIPNLLSLFRLCLIPVLIWLYCVKKEPVWTAIVLTLSGITDIADGIIARKFGMVSDLGKILDPVADKLTQFATLFCLITRFPHMLFPLVLLVVKETVAGITGLLAIKRTGEVFGADWHGKATTVSLYALMVIHLLWYWIPNSVSHLLTGACIGIMLMSFVLYAVRNIRIIKRGLLEKKTDENCAACH